MLRALLGLDASVAWTRPAWGWVGQLGVVALGIHLAADRVDDVLGRWIGQIPVAWPDPDAPLAVGTWLAVALELIVVGWAAWQRARATAAPVTSAREWRARLSVDALLVPVFWAPVSVAGAWVVGMAVEDFTAPVLLALAHPLAWLVAALVGWRLALTGCLQVIRQAPIPRHRWAGLAWAPAVLAIAALAVQHGLPLWGWP